MSQSCISLSQEAHSSITCWNGRHIGRLIRAAETTTWNLLL
ncbi:hypothetical protein DUNSADRAFT_11214 [Dunaliella salina]|uniref:Uncharacterized protein n=1 Tax=Dunaliella salina TaxID=3046 RepID=A0ABQ7FSM3_DUNSA|nr:hypothetical protein DUNSADRAFT_11214 [Dunaliella salina]|eukprot:KAF5825362.1 hypothetical protein DUNSADRAFT_11214 [Dunaliella salina]